MHCPFCNATDTRVVDSRLAHEGLQVRRRRECGQCGERFSTYETAELKAPKIVKSDGRREPFDEEKLRLGIERALQKRPVKTEVVETAIWQLLQRIKTVNTAELSSIQLGEWVMQTLKNLDAVAYVRFASVYRSFGDVQEFLEEIEALKSSDGVVDERQLDLLSDEIQRKADV